MWEVADAVATLADSVLSLVILCVSGWKVLTWYGKDWPRCSFWFALAVVIGFDGRLHQIVKALGKVAP